MRLMNLLVNKLEQIKKFILKYFKLKKKEKNKLQKFKQLI